MNSLAKSCAGLCGDGAFDCLGRARPVDGRGRPRSHPAPALAVGRRAVDGLDRHGADGDQSWRPPGHHSPIRRSTTGRRRRIPAWPNVAEWCFDDETRTRI